VKGFLDPIEGEALYLYAKQYVRNDPCLEIGSYCGKSSVYLGSAVKENGQKLYSIDHHKGSEEQQPGEEYFDSDLINAEGNGIDTLPFFLETIEKSKLDKFVIPIVSSSEEAYQDFTLNFDMVFIDGGHSEKAAQKDYELWSKRITKGGLLAIHDVFPNPEDGGRPPYNIYKRALESGNFKKLEMIKTLGLLKKV
jgi:predicted O-methyltransferase YrrM